MAKTIASDTTWSGRVVFTDDVAVAKGVTLTIAPGTEVIGGGFDIVGGGSIVARGGRKAPILLEDTYINPTDAAFEGGALRFSNVEFFGASTIATSARVELTVKSCLFLGVQYALNLWDPQGASITNSVFLDSFGVSVDSSSDFVFSENFVAGQRVFDGSSYALESWGTGRILSSGNAFLSGDRIALRAGNVDAVVDSLGDYFAGGDPAALVDDAADDPERGTVDVRHPDPVANDALERPLAVWHSLTLPDTVFRHATLLGDRAASLTGNAYSNRLSGNGAANVIDGEAGADKLAGRGGADELGGGDGADTLRGGAGSDVADGGAGDDVLVGNGEADRLYGGDGADTLAGGLAGDTLSGGTGDDVLNGGGGDDVVVGGAGADRFAFTSAGFGVDRILDFDAADRVTFDADLWDADDVKIGARDDDVVLTVAGGTIYLVGAAGVFAPGDIVFV